MVGRRGELVPTGIAWLYASEVSNETSPFADLPQEDRTASHGPRGAAPDGSMSPGDGGPSSQSPEAVAVVSSGLLAASVALMVHLGVRAAGGPWVWAWSGTLALAVGCLAGGTCVGARRAWLRFGLWAFVPVAWAGLASAPAGTAWACLGLFGVGSLLAVRGPTGGSPGSGGSATLARAAALLLVCALLDGSAAGWHVAATSPPWSPETAAWALDLSPRAFVMEVGGMDWMRHPSVYEPAGSDRIGPGIRTPYAGPVAVGLVVVVGCSAALLGLARPPSGVRGLGGPTGNSDS